MANKNHQLDAQIIEAALSEFLQNGYEKASLRKIAAQAGVTVGAIYTRYATKDSLFCALVQPLVDRIGETFLSIKQDYQQEGTADSLAALTCAMEKETQAILHLLFDDYDRAVLLLCRSAGSSMAQVFDHVVERKMEETALFFEHAGIRHPGEAVLRMLTAAQFHMYFQIIDGGYGLEEARTMMQAAAIYHTGGWLALLAGENREREDSHEV